MLSVMTLNVVMLNTIMLSVMLIVVILNVVAPTKQSFNFETYETAFSMIH